MKLSKMAVVLTVLAAGLVFAAGGAHANCTNRGCSGEKIERLYVRSDGSVLLSITGNVTSLDCTRVEGRYLRLERNHPGFQEIYSMLLRAKIADHDVWVRVQTNAEARRAQQCTIRYVVLERSQPNRRDRRRRPRRRE